MRLIAILILVSSLQAAVIADIRSKLSAGDLLSADAIATDFCTANANSTECAAALSWLARGAQMLGQPQSTAKYIAATKKILATNPKEDAFLRTAIGATIETEARLLATNRKLDQAIRLLRNELPKATSFPVKARIQKTLNILTLEAKPAPGYDPALKGKPTLLFLWAHWCSDCKAQVPAIAEIAAKFGTTIHLIAPTTRYETVPNIENPTEQQENDHIEKVWRESYQAIQKIPHPIDPKMMLDYGVSSTPTIVIIDAKGIVRAYRTSRLSAAQIEMLIC
ncbi:MAG: TlpA disulfide reductase family protein [Acidobacteria bacterium]|nr:TlpA disulfide reductase family protein [Acidobacteriota bacterium]